MNDNLPADVKLDGDGDGKVDIISYIAPTLSSPFKIESYGGNWAGGIPHNNSSILKINGLGIDKFSVTIADAWKNVQANGILNMKWGTTYEPGMCMIITTILNSVSDIVIFLATL